MTSPNISQASQELLSWYKLHGRTNLPWRKDGISAYHVWLSEVMLQQTQVSRVIPYFERMVARFPTVQDLAQTSWDDFLPYYQGLGYYSRGRNMLLTAQRVVQDHGGEFPQTFEALRKLPGIGPYTAGAILSFAFQQPTLAFDTNHQRVWGRVLHGSKLAQVDQDVLLQQLPPENLHDLNAAVMDLANLVCTNRNPNCAECPLKAHCVYFAQGGTDEPVAIKKKTTFPRSEAQTIVVLHEKHQRYYSATLESFTPFVLPRPILSREQIKLYFLRNFGLNLAVRPPHWSGVWNDEPTQITFAQVLSGQPEFDVVSPTAWQGWLESQASALQSWND